MLWMLLLVASIVSHFVSIYWALLAWKTGEDLFCKSKFTDIFKSRIEQKFWTIVLGVSGNIAFLLVKPYYVIEYYNHNLGWQEPFWMYGHLAIGVATAIWHYMAYDTIRGRMYEGNS